MKKTTIQIIVLSVVALVLIGFNAHNKAYEPNKGLGDSIATSTIATSSDSEIIIEPELSIPILPITQVEDEYFRVNNQYNSDGLLTSQLLYAENIKLKKDKLSDIKEDLLLVQLDNTDLKEAEVLTLYVRGKGIGTATLKIGDTELITLKMEDKKWLTKWNSVSGWWTQGQINNARVEFTGDIKVSNIRLYAEDQHSLTDNFDSYNDGDLNGQGSWAGSAGFDVQTSVVNSGTKAVSDAGSAAYIGKSFTGEADGSQVFYIRTTDITKQASVDFMDGSGQSPQSTGLAISGSNFQILVSGGWTDMAGTPSANTWYKMEIEWRNSDDNVRSRVDDGTWESWTLAYQAFTEISYLRIYDASGATMYYDDFGGEVIPVLVSPEGQLQIKSGRFQVQ